MQSPCIGDASRACIYGCCCTVPPILGFSDSAPTTSAKRTTTVTVSRYNFIAAMVFSLHPHTNFTNHESLPSMEELLSTLLQAYPDFNKIDPADEIRAREYFHLSISGHVCLDYIGHGLFSYSQLQQNRLGTPPMTSFSSSSTSSFNFPRQSSYSASNSFFEISFKSANLGSEIQYGVQESEFESRIRNRIMDFMNISEEDYALFFTANESSAFKLLAESYPLQYSRKLLTVYDHRNEAVDAMIDGSKKKGARVLSAQFTWPSLRIQSRKLRKLIVRNKKKDSNKGRGLFAFPLQSRITGNRYSYQWMSLAQENGWHVLLDACALGAKDMETLGLSLFRPDFLICSFYKIFGENPSGFGCLFVKKSSACFLTKSSTITGTVSLVPAAKPTQFLERPAIAEENQEKDSISIKESGDRRDSELRENEEIRLNQREEKPSTSEIVELEKPCESGTAPDSRNKETGGSVIVGSDIEFRGLDHADSLGLILISSRVRYLVNWLVNAMMSLQHPNSENGLTRIYGPKIRFDRGPAVAFNIFDWKGEKIDPKLVQKLADRNNISLGCGSLRHLDFSDLNDEQREMTMRLETRIWEEGNKQKFGLEVSVITASLGFLTNFEDLYRLWTFVSRFLDADFVEKERWRYRALNQTTIEV